MKATPPEFAAAGLDHTTQLYQLTMHVNRLRKTVNRLWAWIGVLVLAAAARAAYARFDGPTDLIGKSLVLEGADAKSYTIKPLSGGLGVQVSDKSGSVAADLLLKAEGRQVAVEKDGKIIWANP
jgi:hypothetical protein